MKRTSLYRTQAESPGKPNCAVKHLANTFLKPMKSFEVFVVDLNHMASALIQNIPVAPLANTC